MSDANAIDLNDFDLGTESNEWGSEISTERIAYLRSRLDEEQLPEEHLCPFSGEPLSGADIFWLVANSLVTNERNHSDAEAALRGGLANQLHINPPDLCGASLFAAHLDRAVLSNAQLQNCSLRLAQLEGATLIDANLEHADLAGIRARAADLHGAKLTQADLQGAHLENASLQGLDGSNANMRGAYLDRAKLYDSILRFTNLTAASLTDADLRRAHLANADLTEADLSRADLGRSILEHAILTRVILKDAKLERANLKRAYLHEADFAGARLEGVNLEGAVLPGATMAEANLESANLSRSNLVGGNLRNANLFRSQLIEANLDGATLEHASLREANLEKAILRNANLRGADLRGANLRGVDLRGAVMDNTTILPDDIPFISIQVVDVKWGDVPLSSINWKLSPRLGDEPAARRNSTWRNRGTSYRTAARAYIALSSVLRQQNFLDEASLFAFREQLLNRRALLYDFFDAVTLSLRPRPSPMSVKPIQLPVGQRLKRLVGAPKILITWFLLLLLEGVVGYGERPNRAATTYMVVIGAFSILYHTLDSLPWSFHGWIQALVVSVASFHGRGFFQPSLASSDPLALSAIVEAVIGVFVELAFIASFGKRVLRS